MMSVMKQASARRAEKALREILDKADDNANGRVGVIIITLRETLKNKGIGDAGSTADFRMPWSAIVCLGLGLLLMQAT